MGEATLLPTIGPQTPTQAPTLSAPEGLPGAVELEGAALNARSPEGGRGPGWNRVPPITRSSGWEPGLGSEACPHPGLPLHPGPWDSMFPSWASVPSQKPVARVPLPGRSEEG